MKKRLLGILLSFALMLTMMPGMSLTAQAVESVAYRAATVNAETHAVTFTDATADNYTLINDENVASYDFSGVTVGSNVIGNYTWLVINGNVTFSNRITVDGTANLILCDGAKLTAENGITVSNEDTLNIYGQKEGTGKLTATGGEIYDTIRYAGIGGCAVYDNNKYYYKNGDCGTITINGGTVTANGGKGSAGIGGGDSGTGGNITINGGTVTANGNYASGIGGGDSGAGGNITINGGTVTANGGSYGSGRAGIGCGYYGTGGTVIINGGEVKAYGGENQGENDAGGAGIGGGNDVTVTINGGTVTAQGEKDEKGIVGTLTLGAGVKLETSSDNTNWTDTTATPATRTKYMRTGSASVAVTGVTLAPSDAQTISVGEKVSFTASVSPDNATDKTVKWSVGGTNSGAVKLYTDADCTTEVGANATDKLTVYAKGISAGSATVTATSNADSNKSASCDVTVKSSPMLTLNVGENGKVVMGSGIYGKGSANGVDVTEDIDLTGKLNCLEDYFINVHEGASLNIQTGGGISFYPASDNTGAITAVPADGYAFAGWYNGKTLYSGKAGLEYQKISEDLNLTAIFKEVKYSVTVNPGSNMTKTETSGAATQTDLSGAMTDVVYTANDGYYFPEDYAVTAVNGISVTRNSYTQITVSGTPSADATITLTAPTAKTTPAAPTTAAAVDCTTADNNDGKLTGVTTAMEYKKSDAADWTAGTGSDITGLVPGTYYVRVKATDTTNASGNQELTIADYLSVTKTAAKAELDTLKSGKNQSDYDAADWTTLTQAIKDGKTAIDNATTTEAVTTAKNNAIDAVNAVKTKAQKALDNAKTSAVNTVNAVNANDYIAADQQTVTDAKTTALAAIEAATTIAEVETALNTFNTAIGNCTTQSALDTAKTTAKGELDSLLKNKTQSEYDAEEWTALTKAITDGKTAIDNATTLDAVNTAKTNAETAANAVKTKEQKAAEALAAAKTSAKDALDNLQRGKTQSDYDDEDWTALTQAITNGKTAIDAAETIDAVNTAKTNAENAVNAIKTKAQKAAETLSQAKTAAKGELDSLLNNKTQSDYDAEDWTAITQAISSGKTAIDNAETTVAVDTAKNTAISAVSAVKTKAQKAAEALDTAKISAKAELDNLQNSKHQDDYDAEEWTALTKAVTDGKSAIDNAASIGTVNAARDAAADAVNAVKTKAQKAADAAAAKAVTDKIDALPAAGKVTTSDKAAIEAARKAYDALTADQKAKVSADTLKKLTDDESALAAAEKSEAAKRTVMTVTVNTKTVTAKTLNAAIEKAGGDSKYVTTIVLGKKVKKIKKGSFQNLRNANTLVVKSKKLTKARVKGSLKGSSITKVKVNVGKKKTSKYYVKRYKKIFTKKNCGKKVSVSR